MDMRFGHVPFPLFLTGYWMDYHQNEALQDGNFCIWTEIIENASRPFLAHQNIQRTIKSYKIACITSREIFGMQSFHQNHILKFRDVFECNTLSKFSEQSYCDSGKQQTKSFIFWVRKLIRLLLWGWIGSRMSVADHVNKVYLLIIFWPLWGLACIVYSLNL